MSWRRKSFTLIEMVIVVSVIIVILTMIMPAVNTMYQQAHIKNINLRLKNMINTARYRSTQMNLLARAYGLFFYVDPITNKQAVSFIKSKGVPETEGEHHPDISSRFEIDRNASAHTFYFLDFLRIASIDVLEWEDEDIINNDYMARKQRNFFAVVFINGWPWTLEDSTIFIYDDDADEDNVGDRMGFDVRDLEGEYGELNNVMYNIDEELLRIDVVKGMLVYNEHTFREFPELLRPGLLRERYDHAIVVRDLLSPVVLHRR